MMKYLIAAAAVLTLSAPAMAQSRHGYNGGQHGAQRSHGNGGYGGYGGGGYGGSYGYNQGYYDNNRPAYRYDDRRYRENYRHERRERQRHHGRRW